MSSDQFNVVDRIVILTGGLGRLGRHFLTALLECGARVAVLDNTRSSSSRDGLDRWTSERLKVINADVVDRDSVKAAVQRIETDWGTPHGLINAAAIDSPPGADLPHGQPLEIYPDALWDRVIDVNVKGVLHCSQVVGPRMAAAGRGSIINIGSIYGMVSPDQRVYGHRQTESEQFFKPIAYCASKAAVLNMTRYMATYWAPRKVRVNNLSLGGVFDNQDERFLKGYEARVPLARMAQPDEYNGAILFLLSDASSYVTGSNLVADGGWTAW